MLLSLDYERNLFLTWDQIKAVHGSVRRGETGHIIILWRTVKSTDPESGKEKQIPFLRYYKVFNVAQTRDLPKELLDSTTPFQPLGEVPNEKKSDPFFECEPIIHAMPLCPPIKHQEQKAFYHRVEDYINMPKKKSFKNGESYYSILFHELVHSTGHAKRLNRSFSDDMAETGGDKYSVEELVAEMGASYLSSLCGILPATIDNSAAYIKAWLSRLREDKKIIIYASGHAQKAVDYILNVKPENSDTKNEVEQSEIIGDD